MTTRPASAAAQAPAESRPNVIVFVGDDLGWRDTGPYGNAAVHTPNIAAEPRGPFHHASSSMRAIRNFWRCFRFSAWSNTTELAESSAPGVIS